MLSKPLLMLSAGSSRSMLASLGRASSASRSRIALRYSVRLSRCASGNGPRQGPRVPCAIERRLEEATPPTYRSPRRDAGDRAAASRLVRSFRTTFSQTSAPMPTFESPAGSMTRPPVFSLALWQVTQYRVRTAAGCRRRGRNAWRRRGGLRDAAPLVATPPERTVATAAMPASVRSTRRMGAMIYNRGTNRTETPEVIGETVSHGGTELTEQGLRSGPPR